MVLQVPYRILYYDLVHLPDELFFDTLKAAKNKIIAADLRIIKSELQIVSAYNQCRKIFESNKRFRDPAMVLLMLLTGETQIERAMKKGSITDETERMFCIEVEDGAGQDFESSLKGYIRTSSVEIPERDKSDDESFWRMAKVSISL